MMRSNPSSCLGTAWHGVVRRGTARYGKTNGPGGIIPAGPFFFLVAVSYQLSAISFSAFVPPPSTSHRRWTNAAPSTAP
jgi:hypothetical protein